MASYAAYKDAYIANWERMRIRPNRLRETNGICDRIINNKNRYKLCEHMTGVPWFFIALCHYRESSFNFDTYLGNGQTLHRRTTIVPRGRGPWPTFEAGAKDALQIEGFIGATDWSMPRFSYRQEGFNGYGYHGHGVNSPYLYGGSTVYGPPEARAGKYVGDHNFDSRHVDSQLGTMTIMKQLSERDKSVVFAEPPAVDEPQPDDTRMHVVFWVQHALNALQVQPPLTEDGLLGPSSMKAVASFQSKRSLPSTGLPDKDTIAALAAAIAPRLGGAIHPIPNHNAILFVDSMFRGGEL